MEKSKKKIGLALGGGGARGIAHIGVLKVLEKNGIKPDFIAGTSIGAFIGACYCLGMTAEELEKEVKRLGNKRKIFSDFLDFSSPRKSILKGKKLKKYFNNFLGKDLKFGDLKIPLQIVSTDLGTGEEVIIKRGRVVNAIMSSVCVPGIFPPIEMGGRYLIDGGVVNPVPIDVAKSMGSDFVIGVDLISNSKGKIKDTGAVSVLFQAYEIIRRQAMNFKTAHCSKEAISISPKLNSAGYAFKFYDLEKFIESGEEATKEVIEEIRKKIN